MKRKIMGIIALIWSIQLFAEPTFSVGFSPSHTALQAVLQTIDQAQHSIDVEAYSFTSKPISLALRQAAQKGIKVRVMADAKANSHYSAVTFLANQGIPVRLNSHYAIMHNKVIIVDDKTLELGSFNYSASADTRNAENVLVVRDQPQLASIYLHEFERLWNQSTPLEPAY